MALRQIFQLAKAASQESSSATAVPILLANTNSWTTQMLYIGRGEMNSHARRYATGSSLWEQVGLGNRASFSRSWLDGFHPLFTQLFTQLSLNCSNPLLSDHCSNIFAQITLKIYLTNDELIHLICFGGVFVFCVSGVFGGVLEVFLWYFGRF